MLESERFIFDTGAFALYHAGERKLKKYFDLVFDNKAVGFTPEIVIYEYQYKICQKLGKNIALARGTSIQESEISVIPISELGTTAWLIKCKYGNRFSIVDCFILALAKQVNATILTTDSSFQNLEDEGVNAIIFKY